MPNRLMAACKNGPPEDSAITNCPANAKNTPRQKTSSECWPQTIAGPRNGDFKAGQCRGTKRMVTAASARKWAKRSTSRLVLSIGYIQSANHFGTYAAMWGTYQVIAIVNANAR